MCMPSVLPFSFKLLLDDHDLSTAAGYHTQPSVKSFPVGDVTSHSPKLCSQFYTALHIRRLTVTFAKFSTLALGLYLRTYIFIILIPFTFLHQGSPCLVLLLELTVSNLFCITCHRIMMVGVGADLYFISTNSLFCHS
jgi:hypothetical protein